jgi:hypothetical protein
LDGWELAPGPLPCPDSACGDGSPRGSTGLDLGVDPESSGVELTCGAAPEQAGEILAGAFIALMRETGLPSGIAALGYSEADVPALAEGAFAQQRPLVMAPCTVTKPDLEAMYRDAMRYW